VPRTLAVFYKNRKGNVPVLEWLDLLPVKIQDKCVVKIEHLSELEHELRRPKADLLRNGIYELRLGGKG
jgi:phage-related protein